MKKIIVLSLLFVSLFLLLGNTANAGETYVDKAKNAVKELNAGEDKWIEIQSIILPFNLPVNSGVTSKGNPKYWFTLKGIGDVSISIANYKKYTDQSESIELVKWQKGNKYRYTTRAKGKSNVDLTKIFEK